MRVIVPFRPCAPGKSQSSGGCVQTTSFRVSSLRLNPLVDVHPMLRIAPRVASAWEVVGQPSDVALERVSVPVQGSYSTACWAVLGKVI